MVTGAHALFQIVEEGDLDQLRMWLDAGLDVNQADEEGWSFLHWAALAGHEALVSLLLERGARVDQANHEGVTPLYWAAGEGHFSVARLLLEAGADANRADDRGNSTPLYCAVEEDSLDVVHLLVLHGAQDIRVPETDEMRSWYKLGVCLRTAQSDIITHGVMAASTRASWETLHASNPSLYSVLPRLSPSLHTQERALFGSYPELHYFMQIGSSPIVASVPAIRRAGLDYLKAAGRTFSTGLSLSQAVHAILLREVRLQPDGSWELGKLAEYWERYASDPNAHLGTAAQMWVLTADKGYFNDYRQYPAELVSRWMREAKTDFQQDWLTASCALPGVWGPDAAQTGARLTHCQRLSEWARALILQKDQSHPWEALCAEIAALDALPDYSVNADVDYFFGELLKTVWECDKDMFEAFSAEQIGMLRELALYSTCVTRHCVGLKTGPEESPLIASQLAAWDVHSSIQVAYWDALIRALGMRTPQRLSVEIKEPEALYSSCAAGKRRKF